MVGRILGDARTPASRTVVGRKTRSLDVAASVMIREASIDAIGRDVAIYGSSVWGAGSAKRRRLDAHRRSMEIEGHPV